MLLIASGSPLPLYPAAPEWPPEDPPFISTICSKIRFKLKPLDTILFDALVDILISPFFIVLLLWYPCFELLFSIIRRLISDREPYKPDINHLHQILFKIFQKKIKNKNNLNHFFSSSLINIYNFCSIIIGVQYYSHSQTLILIIIINVLIYCYVYRFLKKKLS